MFWRQCMPVYRVVLFLNPFFIREYVLAVGTLQAVIDDGLNPFFIREYVLAQPHMIAHKADVS